MFQEDFDKCMRAIRACMRPSMPCTKYNTQACTGPTPICLYSLANDHCAGYLFSQQGIKSCGVDTSADVGSTFSITFVVFDFSIPSQNASVTRTGIIINPCDTGQYLCPDRTCSAVACDVRQAVHSKSLLT